MPKTEHTVVSTTLDLADVKNLLSSVLSGSTIEALTQGPLDDESAIAILATRRGTLFNRSPFGMGNAVAQFIVDDEGGTRRVELIAMKDTFTEGFNRQRAAGNAFAGISAAKHAPNVGCGRKMVQAVVQALGEADPDLRSTQ